MKRWFSNRYSHFAQFPVLSFILLASIAIILAFAIQQQIGIDVSFHYDHSTIVKFRTVIWGGIGLSFFFIYIYIFTLFRTTSRELVLKSKENAELFQEANKQLIERTRAEEELKRNYQIQTLLSSLLRVSLTNLTLDEQLDEILKQIISTPWFKMKSIGCIYIFDESLKFLVMKAHYGLSELSISSYKTNPLHRCLCGKVIELDQSGNPIEDNYRHYSHSEGLLANTHYFVPIKHGTKRLGVLNLLLSDMRPGDDLEDEFIHSVADVLAGIIEQQHTDEKLSQTVSILRKTLGGTIQAMALTVETRDPYTAGHQRRVSNLARAIAYEMGLTQDQIEAVRTAGIVHDIGKISVPSEILSKPGEISKIEHSLINIHPQVGYDILKNISFPWPVAQIVLQHHERMDGSGYPAGLTKEAILIEARVLSVADVVEAMASHRPYRPSKGIQFALEEITKNRGTLYDPRVVDACLLLFQKKDFQYDLPIKV